MESLEQRLDKLSPAKRRLLELRTRQAAAKGSLPAVPTIPRRPEGAPVPLSLGQRSLWLLDRLLPEQLLNSNGYVFHLRGPVDPEVLRRCLNEIVKRHEPLRTRFPERDGEPVPVVDVVREVDLPIQDLRHLGPDQRSPEADRIAREAAQRPFDLERGPLFRTTLVSLDNHDYRLICAVHHVISDRWSISVLVNELTALYEAFASGKSSPLAELPIRYSDWVAWQQSQLVGPALEKPLGYWKNRLAGCPTLQLPTDRPRTQAPGHRGAQHTFLLPPALTARLKQRSQEHGVTLFMTLLAGFQVLLYRCTQQADVVVGTPVAGRQRVETEGLIGLFLNMLPLRLDLGGDPTVAELLQQVKVVVLEAQAHQELPFEMLVEELKLKRELNQSPLFQVVFNFHNVPRARSEGIVLEVADVAPAVSGYDLTVTLVPTEDALRAKCVYNADLFDRAAMLRMGGHFQTLLEGIAADPQQRISTLPLLTEAEHRQVVVDWNRTEADYPRDVCLHELFEAQVERTPELPAVIFEGQRLELSGAESAGQPAGQPLARPGCRSGNAGRRLSGALPGDGRGAAGCSQGRRRLRPARSGLAPGALAFLIQDAEVPVLLSRRSLLELLPEHGARVVLLDRDWPENSKQDERLAARATPDNLAYVIYTSGSTGQPKGVPNVHRAICNRLFWGQETFRLTPADRVLQKTPFSFDVSVTEFFAPLLAGAALVLARPGGHRDSSLPGANDPGARDHHHPLRALDAGGVPPGTRRGTMHLAAASDLLRRGTPLRSDGTVLHSAEQRTVQPVRPHRSGRGGHLLLLRALGRTAVGADRQTDRQRSHPPARSLPQPGRRWVWRVNCTLAGSAWRVATTAGPG